MMTGYGMVLPVFPKRLVEFGSGVSALGLMSMAYGLAGLSLAAAMGNLADRIGRRPLIIASLSGVVLANIGYLVVGSTGGYIALRFFHGVSTAGLLPAAVGVIGDTVPETRRARWVGVVMGAYYGAGYVFGPIVGGLLFDHWGYAVPFAASTTLALIAAGVAVLTVPETRPTKASRVQPMGNQSLGAARHLASLPRPLYILATLLSLDFVVIFAFAFVEPQFYFYLYNKLDFTATQVGLLITGYGLAMVVGQAGLGRLSDRFGRRPILAIGFALASVFYLGLANLTAYALLFVVIIVAGFGSALVMPALSASYLDITMAQYRSRILGIKESAAALGGVTGPLLVALSSSFLGPRGVFSIAAMLALTAAALALVAVRIRRRAALGDCQISAVSAAGLTPTRGSNANPVFGPECAVRTIRAAG